MSDSLNHIDLTVICLGSNITERIDKLQYALSQLQQWCHIQSVSGFYETADDIGLGAPYVNIVLSCIPLIDPQTFENNLKELEHRAGRTTSSKTSGIMPLDADIVIWKGEITNRHEFTRPYFIKGYNELKVQLNPVR